jgi:hypothetical protein
VPFVAYRCKDWSAILKEERGLRDFENREQRKIFGPKKAVVKADLGGGGGGEKNGDLYDC